MSINEVNQNAFSILGPSFDETLTEGHVAVGGETIAALVGDPMSVNGLERNDWVVTGQGDDLAVGDMVGEEWPLVDGTRVFDRTTPVLRDHGQDWSLDDEITTGSGNDILLWNGGNDTLSSAAGDDIANAGEGDDRAFGGLDDENLNLEGGDDHAEVGSAMTS